MSNKKYVYIPTLMYGNLLSVRQMVELKTVNRGYIVFHSHLTLN
jgi:hypothetical protein